MKSYIYTPDLEERLREINGGMDPYNISNGRKIQMIGNLFKLFPSITEDDRVELVRSIHTSTEVQKNIAFGFIKELLKKKFDYEVDAGLDSYKFKEYTREVDLLEDLSSLRYPKQSKQEVKKTLSNLERFKKDKTLKPFLEEEVKIYSYQPTGGDISRISIREKTDQAYIEKESDRQIEVTRLLEGHDLAYYLHGERKTVGEIEVFKDYLSKLYSSGMDMYQFMEIENPNFIPPNLIVEFKNAINSTFPIDRVGGKIVTRTRRGLTELADELSSGKKIGDYYVVTKACQNDLYGTKDCAFTIGVGRTGDPTNIVEIKLLCAKDEIIAELGEKDAHILYKKKKYETNRDDIRKYDDFKNFYLRLSDSFRQPPRLLI